MVKQIATYNHIIEIYNVTHSSQKIFLYPAKKIHETISLASLLIVLDYDSFTDGYSTIKCALSKFTCY